MAESATTAIETPGFRALIELVQRGISRIKISGTNHASATGLPSHDDVKPMAHARIDAAPQHIM